MYKQVSEVTELGFWQWVDEAMFRNCNTGCSDWMWRTDNSLWQLLWSGNCLRRDTVVSPSLEAFETGKTGLVKVLSNLIWVQCWFSPMRGRLDRCPAAVPWAWIYLTQANLHTFWEAATHISLPGFHEFYVSLNNWITNIVVIISESQCGGSWD